MTKRCRNKTERSAKEHKSEESQPPLTKRSSIRKDLEREYATVEAQLLPKKPNENIRIETELCQLIEHASTLNILKAS